MESDLLMPKFLINASELYHRFKIVPLLYGSLGLQQYLDVPLKPDDIDILIPEVYLNERWDELVAYLASKGYELIDLHEHTFSKDNVSFSYASIENLDEFAGIKVEEINSVNIDDIPYRILNLKQYLQVYQKSSLDGYRINKKEKKDHEKIKLIERAIKVNK